MKVSICVAQYNRAKRISESIGSLLAQEYDDFEIVLVNDGSPDEGVRNELEKFDDPRLTIVHQQNTGFVGAMNKAIELAKGEYIAIHGAGDISKPTRIAKQASFLDEKPEFGLVSCLFENVVMEGPMKGHTTIEKNKPSVVTHKHLLAFNNPFSQGEVMFRKSLFQKVGGYREYFKFAQDRDLWLRMIDHTKMGIIQEVLYTRGVFSDGVTTNIDKIIVQKHLAALARQCYQTKDADGKDLVDKYGVHAGLFRTRCALLAKYHARQSIEYLLKDNFKLAQRFVNLSISERLGFYSIAAWSAFHFCRIGFFHSIFKKLVIAIYPNSAKRYRN